MTRDVRRPPRRFSRVAMALFDTAGWLGRRVWPGKRMYARALRRGGLEVVQVDVPVPDLPAALDGLCIVQLSDLHAGPFFDEITLQPVLPLVAACQPDLLVLTGDFLTSAPEDVAALGSALGRIHAPLGGFAVFGNHDYRGRREGELAAVLRRQGITVLRNESRVTSVGGARLAIAGLEDIEESKLADLDAARAGMSGSEEFRLLLCHHPDVVDTLPGGLFHLVLSGHSHGGQINLPGLGSLAGRWMPRRVAGSYRLEDDGLLHVNRGLGVLVLPFRIGARAEVTRLTLRRAVRDPDGRGAD